MAARATPSRGSKPDKLMRDALMLALNREARGADGTPTKKLHLIAEKLVDLAVDGDIQAIKEIADRVDGKATQPIAEDDENPLELIRIERVIVHKTLEETEAARLGATDGQEAPA